MNNSFNYISKIKKQNIDIYVFIICNNLKKNIEYIIKLLDIGKIPKKIFDDYSLKTNFTKKMYTDNFEILFVGIGKENNCNNNNLYNVFGKIGKNMYDENKKILIHLITDDNIIIKNQIISYILGFYKFTDFKSEQKNSKIMTHTFFYHPKKKFKKLIENSIYEGLVQNELRSLINTPANILNSLTYSKYIKKNIEDNENKIKIKILNEKQLKKIGCNLILGVNQGSKNKPLLIILEYKHNPLPNKTIALIGKGVMFDSGGYNIKSGDFSDMKNDMTGSAIVYGIFKLLSKFNIDGHFIGLLPIVENMVDSNSIRPGDILKAYNGKTVEIIDTDAEGRLIMADALAYSVNYKPYMCIDIATLTGQAAVIFGNKSSVIMGNNNKYIQKMIKIGMENNEKIWELPMWNEYVELTKSNIADLKNYTHGVHASTIMAGAFLSNFIPNKSNWIHLDIAGVDNLSYDTNMRNYGATGEILRSLFYFLVNFNKESYEK
jgi:leucyl aminopeptidase